MSGYLFPGSILVIPLLAGWYWRKSLNETRSIESDMTHNNEMRNSNSAWLPIIACKIDDQVSSLLFIADGRLVTTSSHTAINHKIRIWVAEGDQLKETLNPPVEHDGSAMVVSITTSTDRRYIVSGDNRGKVMIWEDARTHLQKLGELWAANRSIKALDVSPDSSQFASGSDDGQVVIWCLLTRKSLVGPLRKGASSPISSVRFSPAGDRLASAHHIVGPNKSSVGIWHSRTGALLGSAPIDRSTYSLAWSIDGRRLFAGGSHGSIKCFDITTQSMFSHQWQAPYKDHITMLDVTHNGQFLISASSRRAFGVDVWDICGFSPSASILSCNGARLFSISLDKTRFATIEEKSKFCIRSFSSIEFSLCHRVFPLVKEREHFTYISNMVYDAWECGDLKRAEEILSTEIEQHTPKGLIWYQHANRALVRVRLKNWDGALQDVDAATPCDGPAPLIIYVAKGLVYHGKPGIGMETDPFDSAFHYCNDDMRCFLQSIKSIATLDSPRFGVGIDTIDLSDNLNRLVRAREYLLQAHRYMDQGDLEKVKELLDGIPDLGPLLRVPEVATISLMFDWDLHSLISDIHELRCRTLYKMKSSDLAMGLNYFSAGEKDLSEELEAVTAKLSLLSEGFGDKANSHRRNDEAIAWYTEALALTGCPLHILNGNLSMAEVLEKDKTILQRLGLLRRPPNCIARLLTGRSKAKATKKSWRDALADAEWAIRVDPSQILGHQVKCKALHEMGCYQEACTALGVMSSLISNPQIDEFNKCYLGILEEIDRVVKRTLDECPFILIHVERGHLCDQDEQKRRFKEHSSFYELVSSMSQGMVVRTTKIEEAVANYFRYVMLSHTWEKEEPLFHDVSSNSVYTFTARKYQKLLKFCETVRDNYGSYQWAWNDTCCIDKTDAKKLDKSIKSMYNWYNNSALTLILLANPSDNPDSQPKDSPLLEHNRWMFRAWTLQELLAPKVIRFYYRTWELYLGDVSSNHKYSQEIISELARATGIEKDALAHFHSEGLPVREKLRLASNRQAKERVDIAYSLIGIFKSDIPVDYAQPDAEVPLGLLLQEIMHRRGDVTVLDWFGDSSKRFNSALPADISVYGQVPYKLPDITNNGLDKESSYALPKQEVIQFYNDLIRSEGSLTFQERKLKFPCITISVTDVRPKPGSANGCGASVYVASTEALGAFDFSTKQAPSHWQKERIVLVYPWTYELLQRIKHSDGDEHAKALKVIAYLEGGFRALLFAKPLQSYRPVGYRRIGAEMQIDIHPHELECWKGIVVESLEIWDH